ncbi:MAG TPA: hypothetical protein ENI95_05330 [Chloroflexi bacterium]|nr:hypothetical protein [Chloroflexota bacterium]
MTPQERGIIIPRYKMIISFDVIPSNHDRYYQFILGEFVPALQEMGVYMTEAWHTAYGDYPLRMASFVTEDLDTLENLLESERWRMLESQLKRYVSNYSRKIVAYRRGFQFVR